MKTAGSGTLKEEVSNWTGKYLSSLACPLL